MSKAKKIIAKNSGRSNDASEANIQFDDFCFALERVGSNARAGKGSHTIFFRDGVDEIVNIQPANGGKAKAYQVKQFREIMLKYQLEIE